MNPLKGAGVILAFALLVVLITTARDLTEVLVAFGVIAIGLCMLSLIASARRRSRDRRTARGRARRRNAARGRH